MAGRGWNGPSSPRSLNPGPPDLKDVVGDLLPLGIVSGSFKNGIKMTGMPSFGKIEVPDAEIWSMVAFSQEAADGVGGGLQGLDGGGATCGAALR